MTRMGIFPVFGKRFFRVARKLIGSCQFAHFWPIVVVLAAIDTLKALSWREGHIVSGLMLMALRGIKWLKRQFRDSRQDFLGMADKSVELIFHTFVSPYLKKPLAQCKLI